MSGAEVLADWRRRWSQYKTQPPTQGGQSPSNPEAKTVPGTAYTLRQGPGFLRDVAIVVDLLLDETARNRRGIDELRQSPPPVPLVLPDDVEAELRYAHNKADALRFDIDGENGLHARLVRLEYHQGQPGEGVTGWVVGLTVAGALVSAVSALVCVVVVTGALLWGPEGTRAEGPAVGAEASISSGATADGAKVVRGEGTLQEAYTPREGP